MNPAQCNICEKAAAKFHCNNCGDGLCPICKAQHLKNRSTQHHKIVPYAEKLNPKYLAGLLCPKHQTHSPKFWCKTCSVQICDSCIVTNDHGGHQFGDITAILSEKRDSMLSEMKMLRGTKVGEWEEELQRAKGITTDFLDSIDKMEKKLVSRANEMHREVENVLSKSQRDLQKIKSDGLAKLRSQEKYLGDRLRQLKADVQQYENQLRDADPNALIQFKQSTSHCKDETKPPALEKPSTPVFAMGQNDTDAMQEIFGWFSSPALPQKSTDVSGKPLSSHSSPQQTADFDDGKSKIQQSDPISSVTQRTLIPKPKVQYKFSINYNSPQIACVEQGLAWVQIGGCMPVRTANSWDARTPLQLLNRDGSVTDRINVDGSVIDMTVTPDGDLLIADHENSCIRMVSKQKTISTLFGTSGRPDGLCCLHNNDIVVTIGWDSKVIVYSRDGQVRRTLDHIKFRYPSKVSVDRANKNMYICDRENDLLSYSVEKLIVVGTDGQLRYEYTGQGDKEFTPRDVCTDEMGRVLIIDSDNNRVHILDKEGQFIQYVLTSQQGLDHPKTIDVDGEGWVWVGEENGFNNGHVKVARYSETRQNRYLSNPITWLFR